MISAVQSTYGHDSINYAILSKMSTDEHTNYQLYWNKNFYAKQILRILKYIQYICQIAVRTFVSSNLYQSAWFPVLDIYVKANPK